jgi:hypothetical protein
MSKFDTIIKNYNFLFENNIIQRVNPDNLVKVIVMGKYESNKEKTPSREKAWLQEWEDLTKLIAKHNFNKIKQNAPKQKWQIEQEKRNQELIKKYQDEGWSEDNIKELMEPYDAEEKPQEKLEDIDQSKVTLWGNNFEWKMESKNFSWGADAKTILKKYTDESIDKFNDVLVYELSKKNPFLTVICTKFTAKDTIPDEDGKLINVGNGKEILVLVTTTTVYTKYTQMLDMFRRKGGGA